jgi:hypothetical protein
MKKAAAIWVRRVPAGSGVVGMLLWMMFSSPLWSAEGTAPELAKRYEPDRWVTD